MSDQPDIEELQGIIESLNEPSKLWLARMLNREYGESTACSNDFHHICKGWVHKRQDTVLAWCGCSCHLP